MQKYLCLTESLGCNMKFGNHMLQPRPIIPICYSVTPFIICLSVLCLLNTVPFLFLLENKWNLVFLFVLYWLNEARLNKLVYLKQPQIVCKMKIFGNIWDHRLGPAPGKVMFRCKLLVRTKHSFIISGLSTSNCAVNISPHFKMCGGDLII